MTDRIPLPISRDDLAARIAAGQPLRIIAAELSMAKGTLHKWCVDLGIPRGRSGAKRTLPSADHLAEAVNGGKMLVTVGADYGVTGAAVRDALRRGGYVREGAVFKKIEVPNNSCVSLASSTPILEPSI